MPKIDRVKEFINYLKVLLIFLLVTNISLIGWVVNNYKNTEDFLVYLSLAIIMVILVVAVVINKKIIKDIKSLEEL